jgi:hypothetical protein
MFKPLIGAICLYPVPTPRTETLKAGQAISGMIEKQTA